MQLCSECKNLLYPVAGRDRKLYFKCKRCDGRRVGAERQADNKIFENKLLHVSDSVEAVIHKDLTLDPGLPRRRDVECPRCHQSNVKYFCPIKETMAIYFICCHCYNYWKQVDKGDEKEDAKDKKIVKEEVSVKEALMDATGGAAPIEAEENVNEEELFGRDDDEVNQGVSVKKDRMEENTGVASIEIEEDVGEDELFGRDDDAEEDVDENDLFGRDDDEDIGQTQVKNEVS
ncbi:hypothetical protein AAMO2058_000362300 [Amorphochlora amoebiformis]